MKGLRTLCYFVFVLDSARIVCIDPPAHAAFYVQMKGARSLITAQERGLRERAKETERTY